MLAAACALALTGCSPEFDWRSVQVADGVITGVLPARPRSETREVNFDGHPLNLTMTMAQAGSVLFALGHAPLPDALRADSQAAEALARGVILSFYASLGVPPPEPPPAPGERFVIEGGAPGQSVRLEALVTFSTRDLLEAVVTAEPAAFDRAPVRDFWLGLRMPSGAR
ncbi:hypothetical protein [Castellaniella sp. GW247-6E4]|uniref:hypothetical protein n=1 Tax=Castellaniella sp. GW247-6E4 TaxID=3140380 RepID=UPI0033158BED